MADEMKKLRTAGRIMVTGSGGVLVPPLVAQLRTAGYDVATVGRREVGDINGATDWTPHLGGVDCVVHCAARAHVMKEEAPDPLQAFMEINVNASQGLAKQSLAAGVRRFIHISSISVNGGESPGRAFTSGDQPNPLSPYGVSKVEAERALRSLNGPMELVIVRPPVILGDNPKGNFATLLTLMRKGIPLPFGLVTGNRRHIVTVERLVALIEACIDAPEAAGKVVLVSDREFRSTRQVCEDLARRHGLKARFLPVPSPLLRLMLRAAGRTSMIDHIFGDLDIDSRLAQKLLGEE